MFELSFRVTNDLAQTSNKLPQHELVLPLPAMPSARFTHLPPLSFSQWPHSPKCLPCLALLLLSSSSFVFLSLLPLEEFLFHEVPFCLWCTYWRGQLHLHLSVKKTLNYTFQNRIHVQNLGKQWNDAKIVPENSLLWYKQEKQLTSNEYQLNYSERFTRKKNTHSCYTYEELFKFPKQ